MDYKKINTHYDCFFNSQFIEHVNQFDFMGIAAKYCDKKIITITPRPSNSFWDDPLHIRPYTIKAIKKLYKAYGFKPIFSLSLFPTKSFIVIGEKVKNVWGKQRSILHTFLDLILLNQYYNIKNIHQVLFILKQLHLNDNLRIHFHGNGINND